MGMTVPFSINSTKPFNFKTIIRILGLFGIGLFLNLFYAKFNFNECTYLNICSKNFGHSAKSECLLFIGCSHSCSDSLWIKKVPIYWHYFGNAC
jgi:hypothetical protein